MREAPVSAPSRAGGEPERGEPRVHPGGLGERGGGFGPRARGEACGFRARAGPGVPAACGQPDPLDLAVGFVAGVRGSGGRTPKTWWQMAWSTRPRVQETSAWTLSAVGPKGEGRSGPPGRWSRALVWVHRWGREM